MKGAHETEDEGINKISAYQTPQTAGTKTDENNCRPSNFSLFFSFVQLITLSEKIWYGRVIYPL